jgi:hypothetical protein
LTLTHRVFTQIAPGSSAARRSKAIPQWAKHVWPSEGTWGR